MRMHKAANHLFVRTPFRTIGGGKPEAAHQ